MIKKVISIILFTIVLACQGKLEKIENTNQSTNRIDTIGYSTINDSTQIDAQQPNVQQPTYEERPIEYESQTVTYSFVQFDAVSTIGGSSNEYVLTTDIFETSSNMNEDEKYKILDEAEKKLRLSKESIYKKIIGREIKTYNSYSDASKARESILSINSSENEY
ncbi:hypothetical protein [Chryseobacterium tongliaoense]|uniref:hypothetical protein n=1 Tax=Chryseobacterium tongliaoense TaxID=3240933 RepID=UPI0035156B1D